jgi:hypothetical protein
MDSDVNEASAKVAAPVDQKIRTTSDGRKVVTLDRPVEGHGKVMLREVTLRAPGFNEFMTIGEPVAQGWSTDGSVAYAAEDIDKVRRYAEVLIEAPFDGLLLAGLGLSDTLRVKDAVLDFFREARPRPSKTPQT